MEATDFKGKEMGITFQYQAAELWPFEKWITITSRGGNTLVIYSSVVQQST